MTREEADRLDVYVNAMLESQRAYLIHPNDETDRAYVYAVADYSGYWNKLTEGN